MTLDVVGSGSLETRLRDAILIADQIRELVASKNLIKRTTGETIGSVNLSIGVSQYRRHESVQAFLARADAALYLAAYESRLENPVTAGENRGRTLRHDYVVLEWQGPLALTAGTVEEERLLPLLPGAVPTNSGVVAFVQNRRTAEVLQALMLPACE